MSYSINTFSATPPPGSIMPYLGKTDPDGWVICDGVARTGGNGKYVNVYTILNTVLSVSTNTVDSITPPNLTNKMIYGRNAITDNSTTGGASKVKLATTNIPSHIHTLNMSAHTHVYYDAVMTSSDGMAVPGNSAKSNYRETFTTGQANGGFYYRRSDGYIIKESAITDAGLDTSYTTPTGTIGSTGSGTEFDILNPYMTMNYIMKI